MENNYLVHSSKGTTWGKHKYIRIENGRYIYPEDEMVDRQRNAKRREGDNRIVKTANELSKKYNNAVDSYYDTKKNAYRAVRNVQQGVEDKKQQAVDSYNNTKSNIQQKKVETEHKIVSKGLQTGVDLLSKGLNAKRKQVERKKNMREAQEEYWDSVGEKIDATKHTVNDLNKKQKRKVNRGFQYVARKISNMGNKYEYGN